MKNEGDVFERLFCRQHQSFALLRFVLAVQRIPTNCYFNDDSLIWHCLVYCSQITEYKLSAWIIKSQRSKLGSMYLAYRSIYYTSLHIYIYIMGSGEWAISDRSWHHILPCICVRIVHCRSSVFILSIEMCACECVVLCRCLVNSFFVGSIINLRFTLLIFVS